MDAGDDQRLLESMGYRQELARRMNGFSNFAISFSIICILAGGITSFHVGFCTVGGAAIGIGWPLVALFSCAVAATMAQVASAYPTAGGLYHWASVLGGKGWGWATAWFNLLGLVAVLAAINVGLFQFLVGMIGWYRGESLQAPLWTQIVAMIAITGLQAVANAHGIRWTTRCTDFSGYWIFLVATLLTVAMLWWGWPWRVWQLWEFANYSGPSGGDIWPSQSNVWLLFAMGFLLPAYTITGFDASAHVSEETKQAAIETPRGIIRSVVVSAIAGWLMLASFVIACPDTAEAARQGPNALLWILQQVLPSWLVGLFLIGIAMAQFFCGLATVTSASRMVFAFARDGGLPASKWLQQVGRWQTPDRAVWLVATFAVLFSVWTPVYSTITMVSVIFLYISYVIPSFLGWIAYGKRWKQMGPWQVGWAYRPLAALSVIGCVGLIALGMLPPNDRALWVLAATIVALLITWWGGQRQRFPGPKELLERYRCNLGSEENQTTPRPKTSNSEKSP
jgi:amino acid transporter